MAPAGLYIGALLAAAAVGLIVVFAIAAAAVLVIGPQRQSALTAPMVAAGLAGLSALFFGTELRLDAAAVLGIMSLSAVVVTTFQRLREAQPDTTARAIGVVGGQACIGAAQGLVVGAVVSVVGHDSRLLWILIPTGAVIRGAWAFYGHNHRHNRIATVGAGPMPQPETEPDQRRDRPDVPAPGPIVASPADTAERPEDVPVGADLADGPVTGAPAGAVGMPLKLIGAGVVVLFALAAVAFLSVPGGPDETHVTVFNRTETPLGLKRPYGTVAAFVPACATVVFETSGQAWVARSPAPAGTAVPSGAVEVDVDRLIPRAAEAGPPPAWEVLITSDREQGGAPGTWSAPASSPPCAGRARTSIDFSGSGSTTTAPFRLAGSYQRSVVVTAPATDRCSFAATITGGEAPETIVEPFDAAPGTEPRFSASATYADGAYELSVTSSCSWSVTFVP